jgi:hypothetical protein
MLREGDYQTLEEIAGAENINSSYVTSAGDRGGDTGGASARGLMMATAMQPFGLAWTRQKALFS